MAEGKNNVIVYKDWYKNIEELTDEELGRLMRHFFLYINDKNPVLEDRVLKFAWNPIETTLKRDLKKWENYVEKQRVNGNKGGRPKNPTEPKKPKPFLENPTEPKKGDRDRDRDRDNVSDSDKDIFNKLNITVFDKLSDEKYLLQLQNYFNGEFIPITYEEIKTEMEKFINHKIAANDIHLTFPDYANHFMHKIKKEYRPKPKEVTKTRFKCFARFGGEKTYECDNEQEAKEKYYRYSGLYPETIEKL